MKLMQEAKFNDCVNAVFVYLAEQFPTPQALDADAVGVEITARETQSPPETIGGMPVLRISNPTDDEFFFADCVTWLIHEGYLIATEHQDGVSFDRAVLTHKALMLLEAEPKVLKKHSFS